MVVWLHRPRLLRLSLSQSHCTEDCVPRIGERPFPLHVFFRGCSAARGDAAHCSSAYLSIHFDAQATDSLKGSPAATDRVRLVEVGTVACPSPHFPTAVSTELPL